MSAALVRTLSTPVPPRFRDPLPTVPQQLKDYPQWVISMWGGDDRPTKILVAAAHFCRAYSITFLNSCPCGDAQREVARCPRHR
jgi:hypothetical protein